MIELALNGVVKYFGATQILKNISFEVQGGEKVGLVGRNGSGKSTILKIIYGLEQADSGAVMLKRGTKVGYLAQIPIFPQKSTVIQVLNSAFENLDVIESEMKKLEDKLKDINGTELDKALLQYSELQQKYEAAGGYEREEKLSKVCVGLRFSEAFLNQYFDTLSGGEKTTVILGKILLESPDLLLLDEPTNHLDMEALEWLEEYLKEYKGMVLIVSHDRYFLDQVITKVIEIEDMESDTYIGNYSAYVKEKENRLMLQFEAFQEQQKKIKAMEKAIKELREWAIRGDNNKFFRRAASMQKRLDKFNKMERPVLERPSIRADIQNSERSGSDVIKVENLSKRYGDKQLFADANTLIRYREKAAIIGPNGCGKTTFIKMLVGEDFPDTGKAVLGANVRVGYLPQNIIFANEEFTVLECFRDGITISEGKAREYLAQFLFFGNSVFKKVKNLSGGEKSRLKLSKLLFEDINLLILDEPTNHLDIDSIETLEEIFGSFSGTLLIISHDRYFINQICSHVIALEDQQLVNYLGNYEYYRLKRNEKKQQANIRENLKKEKTIGKHGKAQSLEIKQQAYGEETKRIKLEDEIESLEIKIKEINSKMEMLGTEYEMLQQHLVEKEKLQYILDSLVEQWVNLS